MALPADGYISSATRTTGEIKTGFDDIVTDIARGNPEYVSTRTFEKGAKCKASNDIIYTSMKDGNLGNTPQADDGSNWYASAYDNVLGLWSDKTGSVSAGSGLYHNDALWRVESDIADITASEPSFGNSDYSSDSLGTLISQTAMDYTDGDLSLVSVIYVGLDVSTVEYVIDKNSLTRWSVNGATGTITADDLNTSTGVVSGVSGSFVKISTPSSLSQKTISISMTDATYTLSDGENLYGRIVISGTLTSEQELITSDDERFLVVRNDTDFAIKVRTLGGTGVHVETGEQFSLRVINGNIESNGSGNTVIVAPEGEYSSGSYSYPFGLTQFNFHKLDVVGGVTTGDFRNASVLGYEAINSYPTSWQVSISMGSSATSINISISYDSSTTFSIGSSAGGG